MKTLVVISVFYMCKSFQCRDPGTISSLEIGTCPPGSNTQRIGGRSETRRMGVVDDGKEVTRKLGDTGTFETRGKDLIGKST